MVDNRRDLRSVVDVPFRSDIAGDDKKPINITDALSLKATNAGLVRDENRNYSHNNIKLL